jgi:hypothetical protein
MQYITSSGGSQLLNGAGTSLPQSVNGVSNISLAIVATSSVDRAKQ